MSLALGDTDRSPRVKLIQVDGKLPNLALMRLAHHFRSEGKRVVFTESVERDDMEYEAVYASAIFTKSQSRVEKLLASYPDAIVAGTGTIYLTTVEDLFGDIPNQHDYSLYPDFRGSIGFTQRGCRFKCSFCVVPRKEGRPVANSTIREIWRGPGHPKHIHLLDNDFFGGPNWKDLVDEIRAGDFRVCFNQGINVRVIKPETAAALASVEYRDDSFQRRRLYTAWDNLGEERTFFRGMDILVEAGIKPGHVMAYMLIGYDPRETLEEVLYRFHRMVDYGIKPYPMVYDPSRRDLKVFRRWVIRRYYMVVPFYDFRNSVFSEDEQERLKHFVLNDLPSFKPRPIPKTAPYEGYDAPVVF